MNQIEVMRQAGLSIQTIELIVSVYNMSEMVCQQQQRVKELERELEAVKQLRLMGQ